MTVRAQKSEILSSPVLPVTIDVIQLKDEWLSVPFGKKPTLTAAILEKSFLDHPLLKKTRVS